MLKLKNNLLGFVAVQAVLTLIAYLLWPEDSAHHSARFVIIGSLISGLQFSLLYLVWWRIFSKKKIAPSVITVVIKYALLGLGFWYVTPLEWSQTQALVLGVIINPVALILFALTLKSK